jgi:predicted SAM-dependent methyltransferase
MIVGGNLPEKSMALLLETCLGVDRGDRYMRQFLRWRWRTKRQKFIVASSEYRPTAAHKEPVRDQNTELRDSYCPICDENQEIKPVRDQIGEYQGVLTRKILYSCGLCGFLFTHENRNDRSSFFETTPYHSDRLGTRGKREAELVMLTAELRNLSKDAPVLIYGMGRNDTLQRLTEAGYTNAWASDISDDLPYDDRFINVAKQPDFFEDRRLRFDVVVAVEVWEHFDRHDINRSFSGQFDLLSPTGTLIGTTALWSAEREVPGYGAQDEFGLGQLEWWDFIHPVDHTSFYREANISGVARRFGMEVRFACIDLWFLPVIDPFKRIIAFVHASDVAGIAALDQRFSRQYFPIQYF